MGSLMQAKTVKKMNLTGIWILVIANALCFMSNIAVLGNDPSLLTAVAAFVNALAVYVLMVYTMGFYDEFYDE